MDKKIIFGSWPLRGKFQISRYLLEYLEIPYEEKAYDLKNPSEWLYDKEHLGFDFPNLPYLIDGSFKLTETRAINVYIVIKSGKQFLLGKNLDDRITVESIASITLEIGNTLFILCHVPKARFESKKKETFVKMIKRLGEFSKKLGDKEWLLGYLSVADFCLMHSLEWLTAMDPRILEIKQFQNLKDLMARFYELEQIKNYRENRDNLKHFVSSATGTWYG